MYQMSICYYSLILSIINQTLSLLLNNRNIFYMGFVNFHEYLMQIMTNSWATLEPLTSFYFFNFFFSDMMYSLL